MYHEIGDSEYLLPQNSHVQILHTPVSEREIHRLDENELELERRLGLEKVGWILIDGPSGPQGCRKWTIPTLAEFCRKGTKWFMDDSFRDGEFGILDEWAQCPGITLKGIHPVGKGLGTGIINDPHEVPY